MGHSFGGFPKLGEPFLGSPVYGLEYLGVYIGVPRFMAIAILRKYPLGFVRVLGFTL